LVTILLPCYSTCWRIAACSLDIRTRKSAAANSSTSVTSKHTTGLDDELIGLDIRVAIVCQHALLIHRLLIPSIFARNVEIFLSKPLFETNCRIDIWLPLLLLHNRRFLITLLKDEGL